MKRQEILTLLDAVEDRYLLEAAPPESPVVRRLPRRALVSGLAACMVLALGVTALATGLFRMNLRLGEPGEQFGGPVTIRPGVVVDNFWDAKLLLTFPDPPEECPEVEFRPGWVPVGDLPSGDRWFRSYSTENTDKKEGRLNFESEAYRGVTCQVEIYYACQFTDGGALGLGYTEPVEVRETVWDEWPGWEIREITARRNNHHPQGLGQEYCYIVMFDPATGTVLVIRGQSGMNTLEQVARQLQLRETGDTIRSDRFTMHSTFFDVGLG